MSTLTDEARQHRAAGGQAIARLTPLADVLAALDAVGAVAPTMVDPAAAVPRVLAADIVAPALPPRPVALIDGVAVRAEETRDAGGYASAPLSLAVPVDAGDPLPDGADAVAAPETIGMTATGAEAHAAVAPGDGVLAAGGDCAEGAVLRTAGALLRPADGAVLAAAAIRQVSIRAPKLVLAAARKDAGAAAILRMVAQDIRARGGDVAILDPGAVDAAFAHAPSHAVVTVGGTGTGRSDASILTLAAAGRVVAHGIALAPGGTAALGFVGARPVLMLPGRLDGALAAWLAIGRPLLARLTGAAEDRPASAVLTRKIASTIGIADVVPVRCAGGRAEPLAAQVLPLSALAQADGWVLVPPESEGHPAGAPVEVRAWL